MKLVLPTSVFVPFEFKSGRWVKRDDIPRFVSADDCMNYFVQHPEFTSRGIRIDFQEHSEKWAIDEYCIGVGTLRILM